MESEPELRPEPKPIRVPVAPPPPKSEPKIITLQEKNEPEEELPDLTTTFPADQVVVNPATGTTLYVKPGETLLVRIQINNDQGAVRTYVVQEDRSLPLEWIGLVRDQVNITPGGSGDLAFSLKPPSSAEPATYPFSVSYGILGKPLTPLYLTLAVQATPAVAIQVEKATVSVGPLGRRVPFQLTAESAGNSDTAYRVAVLDETPAPDGSPRPPTPVNETPHWLYLFDKEFDNLVSPIAGRMPPPVPHRLNVIGKGVWWLGWRQSHKVRVEAVPVTDASNGGKPGNAVTLTAIRWRLLPMPAIILIPLLFLLLVLLGSGGDNFRITNGFVADDGAYYVVGTQQGQAALNVHLGWTAPFYSVLKLNRLDAGKASAISTQGAKASDSPSVSEYGQAQKLTYELGSKFFGNGVKTDVRLVPIRSEGILEITTSGSPLPGLAGSDTVGEEKVAVTTRDITVLVPRSGIASLSFKNLTGRSGVNGQALVLWTVRNPAGFKIQDFLTSQGEVIIAGSSATAKIAVDPANLPTEGEATWEMLTTDGKAQLLRIKLKVAGE